MLNLESQSQGTQGTSPMTRELSGTPFWCFDDTWHIAKRLLGSEWGLWNTWALSSQNCSGIFKLPFWNGGVIISVRLWSSGETSWPGVTARELRFFSKLCPQHWSLPVMTQSKVLFRGHRTCCPMWLCLAVWTWSPDEGVNLSDILFRPLHIYSLSQQWRTTAHGQSWLAACFCMTVSKEWFLLFLNGWKKIQRRIIPDTGKSSEIQILVSVSSFIGTQPWHNTSTHTCIGWVVWLGQAW